MVARVCLPPGWCHIASPNKPLGCSPLTLRPLPYPQCLTYVFASRGLTGHARFPLLYLILSSQPPSLPITPSKSPPRMIPKLMALTKSRYTSTSSAVMSSSSSKPPLIIGVDLDDVLVATNASAAACASPVHRSSPTPTLTVLLLQGITRGMARICSSATSSTTTGGRIPTGAQW